MRSPEIEIDEFKVFVNPQVPEDERKQFEQELCAILSDTNEKEETD